MSSNTASASRKPWHSAWRRSSMVDSAQCNTRFLVMDAPTDDTLPSYITLLHRYACTLLVRVCESSYSDRLLNEQGIEVVDLQFQDGGTPPNAVIRAWLQLVERHRRRMLTPTPEGAANQKAANKPCIAVHCLAGLGRAPLLVAIALIESGIDPLDALTLIRKHRRG